MPSGSEGPGIVSRPLVRFGPQHLVQAAAAEALEVERDPGETESPDGRRRFRRASASICGMSSTGTSRRASGVVEAYAELAEAALAEPALGGVDPSSALVGDRGPVGKTRGQARGWRDCPRWAGRVRDWRLRTSALVKPRLDQRMANRLLGRGDEAGAVVGRSSTLTPSRTTARPRAGRLASQIA